MKIFTQDQIKKIKEVDFSMGKKTNVKRFFSISKNKQMEANKQKKILKKRTLESKMDRKLKIIDDYEKELNLIENKIKDIEGE